jgi:hypothetical protein
MHIATRNAYDYFFLTAIVDHQGRQLALECATDDYSYLHLDTVTRRTAMPRRCITTMRPTLTRLPV